MTHDSIKISIVAAIGRNRELGKDNKLLWSIPDDLKRFKEITSGHPIIMGRKTFESIGRPLPNRLNIVITRNQQSVPSNQENLIKASSLEEAIRVGVQYKVSSIQLEKGNKILNTKYLIPNTENEVFIIGGGQIFTQALPLTDRLYLTVIDASFEADTFFPDYSQFRKTISKEDRESDGYRYSFLVLEK